MCTRRVGKIPSANSLQGHLIGGEIAQCPTCGQHWLTADCPSNMPLLTTLIAITY